MSPVIRLSISHSRPTMHMILPFNSFLYVQPQIILLYRQEYERNRAAIERLGSRFDKFRTSLALPVHSCTTEISVQVVHVDWLTILSPSKRTNGGDLLRLAR